MHEPLTVDRGFHVKVKRHGRKEVKRGKAVAPCAKPRVPRVTRLMALAIRFDQLIRDGFVADQAELARLGHVTRARMTQILSLLQLAPDIQEAILFLPQTESSDDTIVERELRGVEVEPEWTKQRTLWRELVGN
jgi:hypothetical protein